MPIDDYFIFNGQKSSDFGLMIASDPHAIHPARRGDTYPIPGRNGVIVREDGSYDTYTKVYDVLIDSNSEGIYERARKIAEWLLGSRGFNRLEDSFEPNVFCSARYYEQIDIENRLTRFGRAQIAFECHPQRFLKSGEAVIKYTRSTDSSEYGAFIEITNLPQNASHVKLVVRYEGTQAPDGELDIMDTETERTAVEMNVEQTDDGYQIVGESDIPEGVYGIFESYIITQGNDKDATLTIYNDNGKEILTVVSFVETFLLINPTPFESRPLLRFTDTSGTPEFVSRTLTMRSGYAIGHGGKVVRKDSCAVSQAVNCSGKAKAKITGNGYCFQDGSGKTRKGGYADTIGGNSTRTIIVPDWASAIVVSSATSGTAQLYLQDYPENPGQSAVTINGVTVDLDFTAHNVIILDCDLHDAHYEDGTNANSVVSFSSDSIAYPTFPGFISGENDVIPSSQQILNLEIVPRWWVL